MWYSSFLIARYVISLKFDPRGFFFFPSNSVGDAMWNGPLVANVGGVVAPAPLTAADDVAIFLFQKKVKSGSFNQLRYHVKIASLS